MASLEQRMTHTHARKHIVFKISLYLAKFYKQKKLHGWVKTILILDDFHTQESILHFVGCSLVTRVQKGF